MSDLIEAAESGDRRRALESLRDLLAAAMEPVGHKADCACECGHDPLPSELARNAAQFRAVLLEIEKLPQAKGATPLDQIEADVADNVIDFAPRLADRQSGTAAS